MSSKGVHHAANLDEEIITEQAHMSDDSRTINQSSYLSKRAVNGRCGRWNRHYFVLDNKNALSYYSATTGKLKGQIVVTEDSVVAVGSRKFGEQCFWLKTPYIHILLRFGFKTSIKLSQTFSSGAMTK